MKMLEHLAISMHESLTYIEKLMQEGDRDGAANVMLSFADEVSRSGDEPSLLTDEDC